MHVITSTFTLGLAHSLILDLRFRSMSTQQRTFEVLKDPTGEKTEDVTVNIESHPDYNRVVHATCGDEPRGEIGIEGTKAEPEAVALHGDVPEWIEPILRSIGIREIR